jgi:hypothetical protein
MALPWLPFISHLLTLICLALANLPVETRLERIVKQMQVVRAEISAQNSKDELPSPYDDLGNIVQL